MSPRVSVIVTDVLLNVALMCTTACVTFRLVLRLPPELDLLLATLICLQRNVLLFY